VDAVSLKLARNYTNEKLNSLPSNRPTKTVSFDGGICSVGNDVVNGQISDVKIKGLTATNMVKNGSFNNGDTNWTKNNSNFVANNGVAEFTAISKYGDARSNKINLIIGNKYYVKTRLRLTTLTDEVIVGLSDINSETFPAMKTLEQTTDWQSVSGIVTINSLRSTTNRFFIKDSRDSEFDTVYLDDVMVIDLTATFGASNEPTVEECDQIFSNWFDGTKSTNSVRLVSVGKNLFNMNDISYYKDLYTQYDFIGVSEYRTKELKTKLKPNTQYTVSFTASAASTVIMLLNSSKKVNNTGFLDFRLAQDTKTFTTGSEGKLYIGAVKHSTNDAINKRLSEILTLKIVEGTTTTEYEPYKESIINVNLPEPLRSLLNGVKDEIRVSENKLIKRIGDKTNVASGTVIDYSDMTTGGQFVAYASDGTSQVGVKGDTLTITATTLTYQLATPIVTKLPVQAPLQVFENGTVYVEPIGDPSETTLPSVEMTIPTGTGNKFGVATHDYGGAAADWILTKNEANCGILIVTNAGGAANIIVPNNLGRFFFVKNDSGYDVVVKSAGDEAGTTIADGNSVIVFNTGD
jgi:hypothetical protein